MSTATFLLINLAVAFYNMGTIWAHEVDIFRSWKLLIGSIGLIWYRPADSPLWALGGVLGCQLASHLLTLHPACMGYREPGAAVKMPCAVGFIAALAPAASGADITLR